MPRPSSSPRVVERKVARRPPAFTPRGPGLGWTFGHQTGEAGSTASLYAESHLSAQVDAVGGPRAPDKRDAARETRTWGTSLSRSGSPARRKPRRRQGYAVEYAPARWHARIHLVPGVLRHLARMGHGRRGRPRCIGHDWVNSPRLAQAAQVMQGRISNVARNVARSALEPAHRGCHGDCGAIARLQNLCGVAVPRSVGSTPAPLVNRSRRPTGLAARRRLDVGAEGRAARDRSGPPCEVADCGVVVARGPAPAGASRVEGSDDGREHNDGSHAPSRYALRSGVSARTLEAQRGEVDLVDGLEDLTADAGGEEVCFSAS